MKIDFINESRIFIDIRDLTSIFNSLLDSNKKLKLSPDTLRYVIKFIECLENSADAAEELGRPFIEVKDKDFFELKKILEKEAKETEAEEKKDKNNDSGTSDDAKVEDKKENQETKSDKNENSKEEPEPKKDTEKVKKPKKKDNEASA